MLSLLLFGREMVERVKVDLWYSTQMSERHQPGYKPRVGFPRTLWTARLPRMPTSPLCLLGSSKSTDQVQVKLASTKGSSGYLGWHPSETTALDAQVMGQLDQTPDTLPIPAPGPLGDTASQTLNHTRKRSSWGKHCLLLFVSNQGAQRVTWVCLFT